MFGPNSSVNIDGSFHISTADYLLFEDGARFDAVQPEDSLLTVALPSAFGFLHDNPADISIKGNIKALESRTLSVIGGNIEIPDGNLTAKGGQINIASVASEGKVVLTNSGINPGIDTSSVEQYGKISLSQKSKISVSSDKSGNIFIRGGQLEIKDSSVLAATNTGDGGQIDIRLSDDMIVSGARISTITNGKGNAGDVTLNMKHLEIAGGGVVFAGSSGKGQGGNISVTARDSLTVSGSNPFKSALYTDAYNYGNAGDISIDTGVLTLETIRMFWQMF